MRTTSTLAAISLASFAVATSNHHSGFNRRMHKLRARSSAGIAYYGYQNGTTNACGTVSADTDLIAGMNAAYISGNNTADCWQHLTVTNTNTGKSVDVTATDNCDKCGTGDVYLSVAAFEALSSDGTLTAGTLNITWAWDSSSSSSAVDASSPSSSSDADSTSTSDAASTSASDAASTSTVAAVPEAVVAPTTSAVSSSASSFTSTFVSASTSASSSSASASATSSSTSSEGWTLSHGLTGQTLIDFFDTASNSGDNSGVAQYVDNLISVNDAGDVVMWVDTTENVNLRNSMKLTSSETFGVGTLMIFDIVHMPTGCGTWPALWLLGGGTWPAGGEIDIIEGVNDYIYNVMSIHTAEGCSITQSNVNALVDATINVANDLDCYAYADNDQTCATTSTDSASYGAGFNAQGGTYAIQIIDAGIYINYWPTGQVPSDITSGGPNPSTWSAQTFFSSTSCTINQYFTDLALIIDTNLGGTFTEGVWSTSGAGGQTTTCASSTGYSTAASYVQNVGSAFSDAYWQISSINIYSQ